MNKKTTPSQSNPLRKLYCDFQAQIEPIKKLHDCTSPAFDDIRLDASEEQDVQQLNDMIGLTSVKEQVNQLSLLIKLKTLRKQFGLSSPKTFSHIIMKGNPGTGKTTVARLLGKLYHEIGALSIGHLIEANRESLTDNIVGGTEKKTKELMEAAVGGVLFIDEAYSLFDRGSNSDFGQRVIDTLMPVLSRDDADIMVIMAGYAKEMDELLDSNPGLRSRFTQTLDFPDYSIDELVMIAHQHCKAYSYIISPKAETKIREILTMAARYPNFGNGRFVKVLIENKILPKMATRIHQQTNTAEINPDEVNIEVLSTFLPEDIPQFKEIESMLSPTRNTTIVGFRK